MSLDYLTGATPVLGKVTPIVGGWDYFNEFFDNLDHLSSGDRLYLLNWNIDSLFYRKSDRSGEGYGVSNTKRNDDFVWARLQYLVEIGVDVRILLWVNTNLVEPLYPLTFNSGENTFLENSQLASSLHNSVNETVAGYNPFRSVLDANLQSIYLWRHKSLVKPSLDNILSNRIVINTLDSTFGGCHAKFSLFLKKQASGEYQATGYTGGIDFEQLRYSGPRYKSWSNTNFDNTGKVLPGQPYNSWHDVMAKVEGSLANEHLFEFYQQLWNENISRSADYNPKLTITIDDTPIKLPCVTDGAELIDDLVLDLTDDQSDHLIQSVSTVPNILPIAPEPEISFAPDGRFTFRDSLHHAISKATSLIYIEDQAMQSLEIFSLIKTALINNSNLNVVLVSGGDPEDAPSKVQNKLINKFCYDELEAGAKVRLHYFVANYTIHSKVFIVDDKVAFVGSGGMFTRSMTEELEHGIVFIDNADEGVKTFRKKLWSIHTGKDFIHSFSSLDDAIAQWDVDSFEVGVEVHKQKLNKVFLEDSIFTEIDDDEWSKIPVLKLKEISGQSTTNNEKDLLERYSNFTDEISESVGHLLMYEVPYLSIFNPSELPPAVTIPFIDQSKVAINQKVRLELITSQITDIAWECLSDDAKPKRNTGNECEMQFSTPGEKLIVATQRFDNDSVSKYPFNVTVLKDSGADWVVLYPTSESVDDLSEQFRPKVVEFLSAISEAGLAPLIIATYRPLERAFLMAYAYRINRVSGSLDPRKIKQQIDGLDISWMHYDENGNFDLAASKQAARDMVTLYGIGSTGATVPSLHTERHAIDMHISIPSPVNVREKSGRTRRVSKQYHLTKVAKSYGIYRLGQSNHWSLTGH